MSTKEFLLYHEKISELRNPVDYINHVSNKI